MTHRDIILRHIEVENVAIATLYTMPNTEIIRILKEHTLEMRALTKSIDPSALNSFNALCQTLGYKKQLFLYINTEFRRLQQLVYKIDDVRGCKQEEAVILSSVTGIMSKEELYEKVSYLEDIIHSWLF